MARVSYVKKKSSISQKLEEKRFGRGYSQDDIAKRLGMSRGTYMSRVANPMDWKLGELLRQSSDYGLEITIVKGNVVVKECDA